MSWWTDVVDVIQGIGGNFDSSAAAGESIGTTAVGYAGAWGSIIGFLEAITDWHLWASLGWIALGAIMMTAGAVLWLKKSQYLPSAVPVPV